MSEPRAAALRVPVRSYTVLVVDDYKTTRDRTRAILQGTEFWVLGEAVDGSDAVKLCACVHPDIVLIAIGLPGISGIEATKAIRRHRRETLIVVLTIYDDDDLAMSAIVAGARAFIHKTRPGAEILYGLRQVIKGRTYFSPELADRLWRRIEDSSFLQEMGLV